MRERQPPRFHSEEVWEQVRRGWEQGETGASLAKRYQVGLANLWRRRASEGWVRPTEKDPIPEPLEGWDSYARRRFDQFEIDVKETRELAQSLLAFMRGEPMTEAPLWHLAWLFAFRAEHLGAETAEQDWKRAGNQPWADCVWEKDGRLKYPPGAEYQILLRHRDLWRKQMGLPDGAAESYP
ncbi:hypothetical protein [Brevundimonas sp.]|uniref:hypothetical protein n=1 Tax=Brevundimonas sp. TaxID=1871086 RepID=UPI002FC76D2D